MTGLGDILEHIINDGESGLNTGYKTPFDNIYIGRGDIITVLGGAGSGKSYFAAMALGIVALEDYLDNYAEDPNRIFYWDFYSLEMDKEELALRFAAFLYSRQHRRQLPPNIIEGIDGELSAEAKQWLIDEAKPLLNKYSKYLTIRNRATVEDMGRNLQAFYKPYGEVKVVDGEYKFITDKHITYLVTIDHVALTKSTAGKKQTIDELGKLQVEAKLVYKTTFVNPQQLNRGEGSIDKLKHSKNPAPSLAEAKDSGDLIDNSTLVLAIFNPHRFGISDYFGYRIEGEYGLGDRARFIFRLKGRKMADGRVIPTAFYGESGMFIKLPPPDRIQPYIGKIQKGIYFG